MSLRWRHVESFFHINRKMREKVFFVNQHHVAITFSHILFIFFKRQPFAGSGTSESRF